MEIAGEEPDILMITEVLPKAQFSPLSPSLFQIKGYKTFFNFDPTCQNLGSKRLRGICVFVKDHLKCMPFLIPPPDTVEALWLTVSLRGSDNLTLGCIYRSPSSCPKTGAIEIWQDV